MRLLLATAVAGALLIIGVVFTTAMFHRDQHPGYLGRTWQDTFLIVTVLFLYAGYVLKAIIDFYKAK